MEINFSDLDQGNSLISQSNCRSIGTPIEMHGCGTRKEVRLSSEVMGGGGEAYLDANTWLPSASEHYQISPRLEDYVLVPIPALVTGLPNTNGDSSTLKEWLAFNPKMGMQAYKTFKGKPTHVEHQNKDITKAKGVILDSILRPIPGYPADHARLVMLMGFDRTKDPEIAAAALKDGATFSIGKWYDSYRCTHPECNHVCHKSKVRFCKHTKLGQSPYIDFRTGHLIYRECQGITGFECSYVGNPAYAVAEASGKHLSRLNQGFNW